MRSLTLISLVSAVLAHFIEINFGIAIAATRTYFWIYAALILLVGYILPKHGEYGVRLASAPVDEPASAKCESKSSSGSRRRRRTGTPFHCQWHGSLDTHCHRGWSGHRTAAGYTGVL